jgi:hypothetical protein
MTGISLLVALLAAQVAQAAPITVAAVAKPHIEIVITNLRTDSVP